MIEAQLVTGATQDRRIFTGSALCAALAPKTTAAATLANIRFKMRMNFPPAGAFGIRPILVPRCRAVVILARVESGSNCRLGPGDGRRREAKAKPPPARAPWSRSQTG